jgi:hypothetical protein
LNPQRNVVKNNRIELARLPREKGIWRLLHSRHNMSAYRNKPVIGKQQSSTTYSKTDDSSGCVWSLLIIVISYFVLSAISRVTSNTGSKIDQIICYGSLICIVIMMFVEARNTDRKNKAVWAERQQWKMSCKSAELTIVNRSEAEICDDGYRFYTSPCYLELEMNSDQRMVSPNQTTVGVHVKNYIYKPLEKCSTVRIYYQPESPLAFLLESEV